MCNGRYQSRDFPLGSPEFEGELAAIASSVHFDEGFRVDLFVEGKVIIELKSVEKISAAHKKQLLTYLKLTNTKLISYFEFWSSNNDGRC